MAGGLKRRQGASYDDGESITNAAAARLLFALRHQVNPHKEFAPGLDVYREYLRG